MDAHENAQLRAIHARLRANHQKLFELQGLAIVGLRQALSAVSDTHDEMMEYFTTVNALMDFTEPNE